ncbi:hypothetical protein, partial [Ferrovibrio sp.]
MDIVIYAGFAILAALLGLILWRLSAGPRAAAQGPDAAAEIAALQARLEAAAGGREAAETERAELRDRLD